MVYNVYNKDRGHTEAEGFNGMVKQKKNGLWNYVNFYSAISKYVTLGTLLNSSEAQFCHLQYGDNTCFRVLLELNI